jgi:broad specificity phosphatase PhoE
VEDEHPSGRIVLVRHGETEWSRTGRHTGRSDVSLTDIGRRQAERLGERLGGERFARVLTSPQGRAVETCALAGFGDAAEPRDDLREWDYGEYEGKTRREVRVERPGWTVWRDGCPGGETAADVGRRADRVIAELRDGGGDAVLFAHGHLLRVLTARWLGLGPESGALFKLDTATLSVLGHERETQVITRWNAPLAAAPEPARR